MKLFHMIVMIAILFSLPALGQTEESGCSAFKVALANVGAENLNTSFLKDCEYWFKGQYGEDGEVAFASRFGYGTGVLTNNKKQLITFTWFAWCNSDAYLQFYFDYEVDSMYSSDFEKVIDDLDRTWDVSPNEDVGITWLGTSNCWMISGDHCSADYKECDLSPALDQTIAKMVKEVDVIVDITTLGYYQ